MTQDPQDNQPNEEEVAGAARPPTSAQLTQETSNRPNTASITAGALQRYRALEEQLNRLEQNEAAEIERRLRDITQAEGVIRTPTGFRIGGQTKTESQLRTEVAQQLRQERNDISRQMNTLADDIRAGEAAESAEARANAPAKPPAPRYDTDRTAEQQLVPTDHPGIFLDRYTGARVDLRSPAQQAAEPITPYQQAQLNAQADALRHTIARDRLTDDRERIALRLREGQINAEQAIAQDRLSLDNEKHAFERLVNSQNRVKELEDKELAVWQTQTQTQLSRDNLASTTRGQDIQVGATNQTSAVNQRNQDIDSAARLSEQSAAALRTFGPMIAPKDTNRMFNQLMGAYDPQFANQNYDVTFALPYDPTKRPYEEMARTLGTTPDRPLSPQVGPMQAPEAVTPGALPQVPTFGRNSGVTSAGSQLVTPEPAMDTEDWMGSEGFQLPGADPLMSSETVVTPEMIEEFNQALETGGPQALLQAMAQTAVRIGGGMAPLGGR